MEKIGERKKEIKKSGLDLWGGFQDPRKMLGMSQEQIQSVLKNERDFFIFSETDPEVFDRAMAAGEYFFETSFLSDNPQEPRGLPIKVFRSREWQADDPKDKEYQHLVQYWADWKAVAKEYLPEDLKECLLEKWKNVKEKYPALGIGNKDDEKLTEKVLIKKTATAEEWLRYKKNRTEAEKGLSEFEDFKKVALLLSPKIEKAILTFQNPLIFRGYDYGTTAFSRDKIKDIRFITQEEIETIKKEGYDGIAVEQFDWFISFKDNFSKNN